MCWPDWLKGSFSSATKCLDSEDNNVWKKSHESKGRSKRLHLHRKEPFCEEHMICGSPMLDVSLGLTHAVKDTLNDLDMLSLKNGSDGDASSSNDKFKHHLKNRNVKKRKLMDSSDDELQPDEILPPEEDTSWVQCDDEPDD